MNQTSERRDGVTPAGGLPWRFWIVDKRIRRARGMLLRLALSRMPALVAGLALLVLAAVIVVGDYGWESWVTDGLGLLAAATGAALVLIALDGRQPDWIDPDESVER